MSGLLRCARNDKGCAQVTLYFLLPPTPAGIMIGFLIDENTVMGIFLWPEV
jgi:hypothetical protein